jgi:hypothetical protein
VFLNDLRITASHWWFIPLRSLADINIAQSLMTRNVDCIQLCVGLYQDILDTIVDTLASSAHALLATSFLDNLTHKSFGHTYGNFEHDG